MQSGTVAALTTDWRFLACLCAGGIAYWHVSVSTPVHPSPTGPITSSSLVIAGGRIALRNRSARAKSERSVRGGPAETVGGCEDPDALAHGIESGTKLSTMTTPMSTATTAAEMYRYLLKPVGRWLHSSGLGCAALGRPRAGRATL